MRIELNEAQEALKNRARDFMERECPIEMVRKMEEDERGYSKGLWRKMADLGWLGIIFPKAYDGAGLSFIELIILLEEMGRVLAPTPFLPTTVLGGVPILDFGSSEQKSKFLPPIANGKMLMTMAATEGCAGYDGKILRTKAIPAADAFLITGAKVFVQNARIADWFVCVADAEEGENENNRDTIFLVDASSKGIGYTVLKTIASDKQCEVVFDKVKVPRENVIGEIGMGWKIMERTLKKAAIAQCAYMTGAAGRVFEMSVEYAKNRVQFDRPIGSFQAIQHRCANMLIDLEGARLVTYEAAWKLSNNLPWELEASVAKAWVSEAYRRICIEGHQIHGGIGVLKDHPMQLYSRRAKGAEVMYGDAVAHREKISWQIGL